MAFHDERLPDGIERGAQGGPAFKTSIFPLDSGFEKRNIDWADTKGDWDVAFGIRPMSGILLEGTLDDLRDFFYARRGRAHSFRFKDWGDYKIGDPDNPTVEFQQIGVGDTTTTTFQIIKTYGDSVTYDRTVTKPVSGTATILLDGVVDGTATVDFDTGIATVTPPPAGGVLVQVATEFDNHVRFDDDQFVATVELFDSGSWPNIRIVELRGTGV